MNILLQLQHNSGSSFNRLIADTKSSIYDLREIMYKWLMYEYLACVILEMRQQIMSNNWIFTLIGIISSFNLVLVNVELLLLLLYCASEVFASKNPLIAILKGNHNLESHKHVCIHIEKKNDKINSTFCLFRSIRMLHTCIEYIQPANICTDIDIHCKIAESKKHLKWSAAENLYTYGALATEKREMKRRFQAEIEIKGNVKDVVLWD